MRELVALGLVRLCKTRPARGAVEHFYELTSDGKAAVQAIEAVAALAPKHFRTDGRRPRRSRTSRAA
jgi:hypothetical protein